MGAEESLVAALWLALAAYIIYAAITTSRHWAAYRARVRALNAASAGILRVCHIDGCGWEPPVGDPDTVWFAWVAHMSEHDQLT